GHDAEEELEQHQGHQDVRRVVLDAVAGPDDLREHEPNHAEERERPHERPRVAERGAVEAQLEVGGRERPGEMPEAPPVAPQNKHVTPACHHNAHKRSTVKSWETSTTAPVTRGPWTTTDARSSRRSIRSAPEPRCATEELTV